ncbi:MAG: M48 family metallopeptidase [Pseudomonadota bacterium]
MSDRSLPGDPAITLTLRRSGAARRFSLRVSRLDGRVTLSLPARAREADALAFAAGQADWIRRAMGRAAAAVPVSVGAVVPVAGQGRPVVAVEGLRAPRLTNAAIEVPPDPVRAGARVEALLRETARADLAAACDRHAASLGRTFRGITLRDTRSRWGSCAPDGSLMFSWRLVMAPPPVLDYVAAHEVAHLAELNHSPAFWAVVARLFPDHARARAWLRSDGSRLHAFRFRG